MASVPSAPQAPELITHSSSTCASTCLRRYFYRYELGLVPSEEKEATHRGSLFHAALEMRDHGATDELGFHAVEKRHYVTDIHATILHLMGLDHQRLTYFHEGLNQRLTGVLDRRVIEKALA